MADHNRNPTGRNQWVQDPVYEHALKAGLAVLHHEGLTSDALISERLMSDFGIRAAKSKVKRRRKQYGFLSGAAAENLIARMDLVDLILKRVEMDRARHLGPRSIWHQLKVHHGLICRRATVEKIMHDFCEEDFAAREPTAKKVIRMNKDPEGIHEQWSMDGHDKLVKIGFGLYGFVDDSTGKILGEYVVPNNRLGDVIGYLYLDQVEKHGGCARQNLSDCGSETTVMFGIANALRAQ
ncbi:hypothetical protein MKEN_00947900 [Mycena kentingensis (nom. inval.)]|nr:hypothetical protein MKEN_00947900 [Mycena kentingensis (nom. inval.)]